MYRDSASTSTEPQYLLECDAAARDDVLQHMRRFKLRSKVDVAPADGDRVVWCVANLGQEDLGSEAVVGGQDPRFAGP